MSNQSVEIMFTPFGDRLLIKPSAPEERTVGGIIIPEAIQGKSDRGTVVAIGVGNVQASGSRVAPEGNIGDEVLYNKYASVEVKLNGEMYSLLRETEVLGVLKVNPPTSQV